jgi:hypothetical protein
MKLTKPILFGVLAIGAYYLLKVANVANVATKARFILRGVSFSGLNLVAKIAVLNPTNSSINFVSFVGDVMLGDKIVATATGFNPVTIGPASSHEISLTFIPNSFGIVEVITDALNKNTPTKLTITGWANMNNFTVPVKLVW